MSGKSINFEDKKINKSNFYKNQKLFKIEDIDMLLDPVVRANKKYYPQALLEECKYEFKKNKMENLINDDLDLSSSDESDDGSDNETDDETDD